MKLSVIVPPNFTMFLRPRKLSHHMVLAQYVLDYPESFWRHEHESGAFILLDNGVAEGIQLPFNTVLDMAQLIHADEIIMPDVQGDMWMTLQKFVEHRHQVPLRQRMAVPHGTSWFEWTECLIKLCDMGCRSIGVAKMYESFPGGRLEALNIIDQHMVNWTHDIHLLGCYNRPYKEIREVALKYPWVRSVDTAAPIAYAQQGCSIDADAHCSINWYVDCPGNLVLHNINLLLEACNAFNLEES